MLQSAIRAILLTATATSQHLHLPVLEAVATGRLALPKGKEGTAVGIFPHLASDSRDGNTIYSKTTASSQKVEDRSSHQAVSDRVQIASVDVVDLRTKAEQLRNIVQATDNAYKHAELAQTLQVARSLL